MATNNVSTIRLFCESWATRDVDRVTGFMTEDCFYHNVPIDPVVGRQKIRDYLKPGLDGAQAVEFAILSIAEAEGGAVLTERLDRFLVNGKWVELPVMGIFELDAGKIAKWRDYFDLAQFNARMGAALNG